PAELAADRCRGGRARLQDDVVATEADGDGVGIFTHLRFPFPDRCFVPARLPPASICRAPRTLSGVAGVSGFLPLSGFPPPKIAFRRSIRPSWASRIPDIEVSKVSASVHPSVPMPIL